MSDAGLGVVFCGLCGKGVNLVRGDTPFKCRQCSKIVCGSCYSTEYLICIDCSAPLIRAAAEAEHAARLKADAIAEQQRAIAEQQRKKAEESRQCGQICLRCFLKAASRHHVPYNKVVYQQLSRSQAEMMLDRSGSQKCRQCGSPLDYVQLPNLFRYRCGCGHESDIYSIAGDTKSRCTNCGKKRDHGDWESQVGQRYSVRAKDVVVKGAKEVASAMWQGWKAGVKRK